MIEQLLAIVRNSFFESIRQPIVLVVLVAAAIFLILSNPLSAFTMDDDQRMFIDVGLATVFLCGALLASFVATNVISREIDNKTALTVISKPVGRPMFVIGKFLGVGSALVMATLFMCFVFLLVERHGVLQTVRDPIHLPVLVFGISAGVIGLAVAIWCNYFYGKVFASTVICITTPILALAYFLSLLFKHDFTRDALSNTFRPDLWMAMMPLIVAILVLTAVAIAASTRLGQVMTLCITLGVFLLGMMSDYLLGRPIRAHEEQWLGRARDNNLIETVEVQRSIELVNPGPGAAPEAPIELVERATVPLRSLAEGGEMVSYTLLKAGHAIVPNFQVLWLSDAVTQGHKIPLGYVAQTCLYGGVLIMMMLALATILFQRREVG